MGWLLPLTYTRPKHVDGDYDRYSEDLTMAASDKSNESVKSGNSGASSGIPDSLTFDKIINGGTCPPMTVRDFMNYLIYVEHSAENLQFFLWFRDYEKRFREMETSDLALAPEWTQVMEDDALAKMRKMHMEKMKQEPKAADIFKGSDFEKQGTELQPVDIYSPNPFNTPPQTAYSSADGDSNYTPSNAVSSTHASTYQSNASSAFAAAGTRQPFTIQPCREEINRIISIYIMDGAPRQLNLSSSEQKVAVQALSYTTHPTALRGLVRNIEAALRHQAHPNFVRWSICNGNPARVFFARALGVGTILAGIILAVLLTLSGVPRGYRALPAIAFVLGISTLVAAYKGMCVVLHGMHHHHVRPWELFTQDDNDEGSEAGFGGKGSFESFGSSNSYEDEPWVVKYEKRNVIRKIFDREVWIQEPALRQIQDTIFVQAMLAAVLGAGALTAIFVAVPGGNFF